MNEEAVQVFCYTSQAYLQSESPKLCSLFFGLNYSHNILTMFFINLKKIRKLDQGQQTAFWKKHKSKFQLWTFNWQLISEDKNCGSSNHIPQQYHLELPKKFPYVYDLRYLLNSTFHQYIAMMGTSNMVMLFIPKKYTNIRTKVFQKVLMDLKNTI